MGDEVDDHSYKQGCLCVTESHDRKVRVMRAQERAPLLDAAAESPAQGGAHGCAVVLRAAAVLEAPMRQSRTGWTVVA